jgi:hypothetical protein
MHPTVHQEIMKARVADMHRDAAQDRFARAARRSRAQAAARQRGSTPTRSLFYRLLTAVSARTARRTTMPNSHQLTEELNRDKRVGGDHASPVRELQSQPRIDAADQALQAIRQAINEIDAIIESALNCLPEIARGDEHAEYRPADSGDTKHFSAVPTPDDRLSRRPS